MKHLLLLLAVSVLATPFLVGCSKPKDDAGKTEEPAKKKPAHPTEGPNKGSLIELGDDEYHGELVQVPDTSTVSISILDGSATKYVPIVAKEVIIELTHAGKREQHKLLAKPREGDPKGKSSRFEKVDEELIHDLTHKNANPKIILRIGEKSYSEPIKPGKHVH